MDHPLGFVVENGTLPRTVHKAKRVIHA